MTIARARTSCVGSVWQAAECATCVQQRSRHPPPSKQVAMSPGFSRCVVSVYNASLSSCPVTSDVVSRGHLDRREAVKQRMHVLHRSTSLFVAQYKYAWQSHPNPAGVVDWLSQAPAVILSRSVRLLPQLHSNQQPFQPFRPVGASMV